MRDKEGKADGERERVCVCWQIKIMNKVVMAGYHKHFHYSTQQAIICFFLIEKCMESKRQRSPFAP